MGVPGVPQDGDDQPHFKNAGQMVANVGDAGTGPQYASRPRVDYWNKNPKGLRSLNMGWNKER